MTQDNSYEILYWTVQEGAAPKIDRSKQRDTKWAEWTSTLGFPVMGIWPEGTDGTDINSVHRSHKGVRRGRGRKGGCFVSCTARLSICPLRLSREVMRRSGVLI